MKTPSFKVLPDDPEWWCVKKFVVSDTLPPIRLSVVTDGTAPTDSCIASIVDTLAVIDTHILAAADLILNNYSYEHFKSLGVNEKLLVKDETPGAIAKAVRLREACFRGQEGESFELSFTAPWDNHHTFDVEFENGRPTCCAVNG